MHTVKYNPRTEISCSRAHNAPRNRLDPTIHSAVCKNWELTPRGCIVTWNVGAPISNLVLIRFRYGTCRPPPEFRFFTFSAETSDRPPVAFLGDLRRHLTARYGPTAKPTLMIFPGSLVVSKHVHLVYVYSYVNRHS